MGMAMGQVLQVIRFNLGCLWAGSIRLMQFDDLNSLHLCSLYHPDSFYRYSFWAVVTCPNDLKQYNLIFPQQLQLTKKHHRMESAAVI